MARDKYSLLCLEVKSIPLTSGQLLRDFQFDDQNYILACMDLRIVFQSVLVVNTRTPPYCHPSLPPYSLKMTILQISLSILLLQKAVK